MPVATVTRPFTADACRIEDLHATAAEPTAPGDVPLATTIERGVPVYDAVGLRSAVAALGDGVVGEELAAALLTGPGVFVVRGAVAPGVVERATAAFRRIIDEQRAADTPGGDHFAAPGANDRIWNALEKLARSDPDAFVDYYANDMIALAALAWLGPGYQVTSQVNVVNPGGQAQLPHCDYHLGFTTEAIAARYPRHVHRLSPMLTLQGAVAHSDMPVESGPTMYLPHSQKYDAAYLAWRRPDVVEHFRRHHVQLPLGLGDAVFFNPALLHAAGTNRTTDVRRMANLLQISSAFGRAMETVDRTAVTSAIYPALLAGRERGVALAELDRVVAAAAEGYAFPTNLDRDPPLDGLSPRTQADIVRTALRDRWPAGDLRAALDAHRRRTMSA